MNAIFAAVFGALATLAAAPSGAAPGNAPEIGAEAAPEVVEADYVPPLVQGRWGLSADHCRGTSSAGMVIFRGNTVEIDGRTGRIARPVTSARTYFRSKVTFGEARAPTVRDLAFSVRGGSNLVLDEYVERRRRNVGIYQRCS